MIDSLYAYSWNISDLVEGGLGSKGSSSLHHVSSSSLYTCLFHMSHDNLKSYYEQKLSFFTANNLLYSGSQESREIIAKVSNLPASNLLYVRFKGH